MYVLKGGLAQGPYGPRAAPIRARTALGPGPGPIWALGQATFENLHGPFENLQGPFENIQGPFENIQGPFENIQGPFERFWASEGGHRLADF